MSWRSRLIVVAALAGVAGAPLLTLHPTAIHLWAAGERGMPHEVRDAAVLVLFALFGASLVPATGMAKAVGTWLRQAAALRRIREQAQPRITREGEKYFFLDLDAVQFFTAGVFRTRIYATRGALQRLEPDAFRAAILHEREHQRSHDVVWRIALAALETAFRPIAPVRRSIQSLAMELEFAADRAAIASGASRLSLFEAVVAATSSAAPGAAVGLTGSATMERLEALASPHPHYAPSRAPLLALILGLASLPLGAHGLFWLGAVCL